MCPSQEDSKKYRTVFWRCDIVPIEQALKTIEFDSDDSDHPTGNGIAIEPFQVLLTRYPHVLPKTMDAISQTDGDSIESKKELTDFI